MTSHRPDAPRRAGPPRRAPGAGRWRTERGAALADARIEVRLLGETAVTVDGVPVTLGGPKPRSLVALLAMSPGVTVGMGRLVELLWGADAPAKAENNVQVYVSRLRKVLRLPAAGGGEAAEPFLLATPAGYQLRVPDDAVDAVRFQRWAEAARRLAQGGQPEAAEELFARAESLWRGDDLPDLAGLPTGEALTPATDRAARPGAGATVGGGTRPGPLPRRRRAAAGAARREPPGRAPRGPAHDGPVRGGSPVRRPRRLHRHRCHARRRVGVDPGPALKDLQRLVLRQELPVLAPTRPPTPAGASPPTDRADVVPPEARPSGTRELPIPPPTPRRSSAGRTPRRPGRRARTAARARRRPRHAAGSPSPGREGAARRGSSGRSPTGSPARRAERRRASSGAVRAVGVRVAPRRDPRRCRRGRHRSLPDHVASGLAPVAASGRRSPLEVVREALAGRGALVVLDNLEQLVDAHGPPTPVSALLDAVGDATVLATSRSVLRLRGEHLVPLEPLPLPPSGCTDAALVAASDAVRLFRQRARAALPASTWTPATRRRVADVVRLLDGLPLALELAAARVRVLPPAELLARMDRRLRLLTGGPGDAPRAPAEHAGRARLEREPAGGVRGAAVRAPGRVPRRVDPGRRGAGLRRPVQHRHRSRPPSSTSSRWSTPSGGSSTRASWWRTGPAGSRCWRPCGPTRPNGWWPWTVAAPSSTGTPTACSPSPRISARAHGTSSTPPRRRARGGGREPAGRARARALQR